ncbi:hypothetical protein H0H92_006974 [Tricholoma furcatifolium]|nr:hypothetical protein H0H92_006974 [Tricholoma furcatifolium]
MVSSEHEPQDPQVSALIARLNVVLSDVNIYRRLVACWQRPRDAQILLDSFQRLLNMPDLDTSFRNKLIVATQRISIRSGLYPTSYELKDVVQVSQHPVNSGGFADIYKGNLQGQAVCLKTIRLYEDSEIKSLLKQMSKEAILWAQLSHPNVLTIYGVFFFQKKPCIVSPWMDDGNVNVYLKHNPGTPRRPLVADVAKGLAYLHSNGIIHGDLKGPNILVDGSGRAKLADFGISAVSDSKVPIWTSQSSVASKGGSVRWQAPELIDIENGEEVKNSLASDVYAWGCVAFELFTGTVPFAHIQRDTTILFHVKSGLRPERPSSSSDPWMTWGLTEEIWALMEQSWKSQPAQRPSSAAIVEHLGTMIPNDTRPIPGTPILTPETFYRKISSTYRALTVEALNVILENAPYGEHIKIVDSDVSTEIDPRLTVSWSPSSFMRDKLRLMRDQLWLKVRLSAGRLWLKTDQSQRTKDQSQRAIDWMQSTTDQPQHGTLRLQPRLQPTISMTSLVQRIYNQLQHTPDFLQPTTDRLQPHTPDWMQPTTDQLQHGTHRLQLRRLPTTSAKLPVL